MLEAVSMTGNYNKFNGTFSRVYLKIDNILSIGKEDVSIILK